MTKGTRHALTGAVVALLSLGIRANAVLSFPNLFPETECEQARPRRVGDHTRVGNHAIRLRKLQGGLRSGRASEENSFPRTKNGEGREEKNDREHNLGDLMLIMNLFA